MLEKILDLARRIIPKPVFTTLQPAYHFFLALAGVLVYRFPSRELYVLAVTGTKGKTTVLEVANAILEAAGKKTALASTLRIKTGEQSEPNKFKVTIKGRFFVQRFLRRAVQVGCQYALVEMTSEGAKQYRHRFIDFDALIFTNLSPEHIESHGSFENYRAAKLSIARRAGTLIINGDDPASDYFLRLPAQNKIVYRLNDAAPWQTDESGSKFTLSGQTLATKLPGKFNLYNVLAATTWARSIGIGLGPIKKAINDLGQVRGRVEKITMPTKAGQPNIEVIVDYAHTPGSLQAVYELFRHRPKICVLGSTGGGRDKWKRPVMGRIAGEYCKQVILTNEDPYDEPPGQILEDLARGLAKKEFEKILDRRLAIRRALTLAKPGDIVIITGKGTDPYIMGPGGHREPWDDATVVREELKKLDAGIT